MHYRRQCDNGPKRATMAVHGPSGVGVVATSIYPASECRAILVLPAVIEATFIPMEEVVDSDVLRMHLCK